MGSVRHLACLLAVLSGFAVWFGTASELRAADDREVFFDEFDLSLEVEPAAAPSWPPPDAQPPPTRAPGPADWPGKRPRVDGFEAGDVAPPPPQDPRLIDEPSEHFLGEVLRPATPKPKGLSQRYHSIAAYDAGYHERFLHAHPHGVTGEIFDLVRALFLTADFDGNNGLEAQEIDRYRDRLFDAVDANGDKGVSLDEFLADGVGPDSVHGLFYPHRLDSAPSRFLAIDMDENGILSLREWGYFAPYPFGRRDRNHDGFVDWMEFTQPHRDARRPGLYRPLPPDWPGLPSEPKATSDTIVDQTAGAG